MSDEQIQEVPPGMIRLGGEKPALRMATTYRDSGQIPLTKSALSLAEQGLRGAGFGAYAIEPEILKYRFTQQIPLQAEGEEGLD